MKWVFVVFALLAIALCNTAMAENAPHEPEHCLPTDSCFSYAPVCVESPLFFCQNGTWVCPATLMLDKDITIAGPVRIEGNFTLYGGANITFNNTLGSFLTVHGFANFSAANETWTVNLNPLILKEWSKIEDQEVPDWTPAFISIFAANGAEYPHGWEFDIEEVVTCHHPNLSAPPSLGFTTVNGQPGSTFYLRFTVKSACYWYGVFIGIIVGFFLIPVIFIIIFRTVPSIKKWTAPIPYDPNNMTFGVRKVDNDEFEMEHKSERSTSERLSQSRGSAAASSSRAASYHSQADSSDEGDSVALDY